MAYKNVVCSFDYENDRKYYNLLEAWNKNPNIEFFINDCTPSEIQSESVSKIKQVLSTKIGQAKYMVALIGKHEKGNGLVCVKLDSSYDAPIEAYGIGAKWVYSFNLDDINNALKELAK